jgi:hypothetical protein
MNDETVLEILEPLDFDKKRPVTSAQKKAYMELQQSVDDARQRLNKLHLRLWHAVNSRDYHSLSLEEARETLESIARHIDAISKN